MTDLETRKSATEDTVARFKGVPFTWGKTDCAKIAAWHLRRLGNHRSLGLHKAGTYRTALGARRALSRAGYSSIADALTKRGYVEIPPAAALIGDLMVVPGEHGFEALTIFLGNSAVFGFHEDAAGAEILRISDWPACRCWRALL